MTRMTATTPDAFADRVLESARGAFEILTMYIGVRLGYYDALADGKALTSTELATATGTVERYAREWLEQQTVAGFLEVEDERAEAKSRSWSTGNWRSARMRRMTPPTCPVAPTIPILMGTKIRPDLRRKKSPYPKCGKVVPHSRTAGLA